MTVSHDGRLVAGISDAAPRRRDLQIADLDGGEMRSLLETQDVDLHAPCFSRDGKLMAVGYRRQARILDIASGKTLATYETPNGYIGVFCFAPDGKRVAFGTSDGLGVVWDWSANHAVRFREPLGIWALQFDREGGALAVGISNGDVRAKMTVNLRDSRTGTGIREIVSRDANVYGFALAADGKIALWGVPRPSLGLPAEAPPRISASPPQPQLSKGSYGRLKRELPINVRMQRTLSINLVFQRSTACRPNGSAPYCTAPGPSPSGRIACEVLREWLRMAPRWRAPPPSVLPASSRRY